MATNNNQQAPAANQEQGSIFKSILNGIMRLVVMYTISRFLFGTKQTTTNQPQTVMKQTVDPNTGSIVSTPVISEATNVLMHNLFPRNCLLDMHAFISDSEEFPYEKGLIPFWVEESIPYSADNDEYSRRVFSVNITKSSDQVSLRNAYDSLVRNETQYLHMFFTREKISLNPNDVTFNVNGVHHITKQLNRYYKEKKNKKKNLLAGSTEKEAEELEASKNSTEPDVYKSYWNSDITVALVDFQDHLPRNAIPPHILNLIQIRQTKKTTAYEPIIYINDFWVIRERMMILNETVDTIPLNIEIKPTSAIKWQLFVQMQMSLDMQKSFGAMRDGEGDDIKRLLLDTNPYLLAITIVVSIVHSVLDFLAFKNDITFWKNKENVEGLSVRSMFVNLIFQTLILLYLFDNETSWLILGSSAVGLAIEVWKMKKAVNFKRINTFPFLTFDDKASYTQSKTKEYDQEAMRYVSYLLYPLLLMYAIYSLYYESHKSWYSWVLGTAVGFIYMFGFIMMTPQLFINYKLKSVAHLNLKTFAYKAVNTFIDDLFSFVIKMPTLHRLACFRDDIIFFIYLYQRWIYPVDKSRVNEFGQCEEPTANLVPVNAAESSETTAVPAIEATQEEKQQETVVEQEKEEEVVASEDNTSTLRHREVSNKKKKKKSKKAE
jgi:hypothetical protein